MLYFVINTMYGPYVGQKIVIVHLIIDIKHHERNMCVLESIDQVRVQEKQRLATIPTYNAFYFQDMVISRYNYS